MEKIDFESEYLAEYIYNWAIENYVVQDAHDVHMSICEFVKWYRFQEFQDYMKTYHHILVIK